MNQKPKKTAWVYVSLIPALFVTLGLTVTLSAFYQQWGGSTKAAQVFAIFFAEVTIVIAAAGLLAYYLRTPEKTFFRKAIAYINWSILFSAIGLGLYLFLG